MAGTPYDDDYVANLMKRDAKTAAKKYELVGMDAFNPKRLKSGAPKPNTNFLRHIIRQTDNHNAALLAREAEDSSARLQLMNRRKRLNKRVEADVQQNKVDGRLTPVVSDQDAPETPPRPRQRHNDNRKGQEGRRRDRGRKSPVEVDEEDHETGRRSRDRDSSAEARYRRHRDSSAEARSRRHRESSEEARRRKRRREDSDEDGTTRKRRRSRSRHEGDRRHRHTSEHERRRSRTRERVSHKHSSRRAYTTSTSRSRSRSPRRHRGTRRHRSRDRSYSPESTSRSTRTTHKSPKSSQRAPTSAPRSISRASDSDPLEAIVGPLPPSNQPAVRARGRGFNQANAMGIESRFSSTYNPTTDVRQDDGADDDDWGTSLEALRDRQIWQQQGADRLKAAGFSDEQIKRWAKGGEQTEEDVTWTRKGQAREWDWGKVVDEDGDIQLKADYGRLK